jgi:histone H3/H4
MRGFSLYDMEQFLKDAGAGRVNETAVVSLEKELNDTVRQLVEDAQVYANYAGRKRIIKGADIAFARAGRRRVGRYVPVRRKGSVPERLMQRNRLVRAVARHPAIVQ